MKKDEAIFWRDLLRSGNPLTRQQRDELALILDDHFVHPTGGAPYKTARGRMNRNFSTAVMEHLLQDEIGKGKSRRYAAASVARELNRNGKSHGLKPLTGAAIL